MFWRVNSGATSHRDGSRPGASGILRPISVSTCVARDLIAVHSGRRFFKRAIKANGVPQRIVIDKSGANLAGLLRINVGLKFSRSHHRIEILRVKYLNNIVEQDHRFIKKITRPTLGFKAFHSAAATLAGIEVAHMIRKKQIQSNHTSPFEQFASLAA